jgi:hypothetical protein
MCNLHTKKSGDQTKENEKSRKRCTYGGNKNIHKILAGKPQYEIICNPIRRFEDINKMDL